MPRGLMPSQGLERPIDRAGRSSPDPKRTPTSTQGEPGSRPGGLPSARGIVGIGTSIRSVDDLRGRC